MNVLSDTKRLKARLTDIQSRMLFDRVIKHYKQSEDIHYYYAVQDRRHGVYLGQRPRAPYMNYTTSLSFHGYSNDSQLLKRIFSIIPLEEWLASEVHVAFDYNLPYEQFHAVRPRKRADVKLPYPTSMYMGGKSSATRLYIYDKQVQMKERKGIHTDTWTRVELRFRFSPMKSVLTLTVEDFKAADQYHLFTDISLLPKDLKQIVSKLNKGMLEWKAVDWRTKTKIREYASEQGDHLYRHILSNVGDLNSFIYSPSIELPTMNNISI